MKSIISAIALTVAFCIFTPANASAQVNEILKRMDTHYKALASLKADVSREVTNSQLNETDKQSGNLTLLPGKGTKLSFRLNWTSPKEENISVVNGKYIVYIPSYKRVYVGSSSSKTVKDKGGNALAVMSMSKEEIKANYDATYIGAETVGGTDTLRMKLTPKAKADYKYIELWVDGNGMPIQGKIVKLNNDSDTIRFSNLKKNEKVDKSVFAIKPPKGTEIVKG
ncbi:MAG: outer membrane lipoprotein carrier protein LolA [Acidobacteria bacterium]|nr:outer membrane lipoprotein carrier protein LolA [Acidobacteriota bacterium]